MNFQNHAILSLGSNTGNRQQHIESCINYIHNTIATVIKVSGIYQTPSWGFESADFYNCAVLVHTCKPATVLLDELLQAEAEAGRVRSEGGGYQARSIDIDIIAFNNAVINEPNLHVPHPRMAERNFVLYPIRDIAPQWIHPVLGKDIDTLIEQSTDESECKFILQSQNPLDSISLRSINYLAVEGNIGAGKTSLSSKIAEDFNARLVQERFADNPFLPKFYKDQARYAFSLEMSFLADRYQQLTDDLSKFDLSNEFIVADYHIVKSLIFSKITLGEDEYNLYRKLFDIMYKEMTKPDLYIYLYQNTERLLEQIKKRGRAYEQDIQPEYLDKINTGYLEYIKAQKELNVMVIDVTDKDFVNSQQDYVWLLDAISSHVNA